MPGNPKFDPFHKVKMVPKLQKSTDRNHKLISSEGGQDTSAYKISAYSLYAFFGKCPETPNLTRFTKSKRHQKEGKSIDRDQNLISSDGGQGSSSCKISAHSLHAFSGKCPETYPDDRTDRQTYGRTDGHSVKGSRLVGWTNGPMSRWKEGISGFGRTDGQTDNPKT